MTYILAKEFSRLGNRVKVVSQVPSIDQKEFPFEVIRRPNPYQLLRLTRWSDIFFQSCVSLKGIWPLVLVRRPYAVTHQTWYHRSDGRIDLKGYWKFMAIRLAQASIAASSAIAQHIPSSCVVISNPYDADVFHEIQSVPKDKELIFVGRLVSDKGVDLLLHALADLGLQGLAPRLTIVGKGPEEASLKRLVLDLNIADLVTFVGLKMGHELASLLNANKIMVIPSRWQEPFGIVALEGIACGCVVVGSEGGGLRDAIGTCGMTFPNGDVKALTRCLADLISQPSHLEIYRKERQMHLSRHKPQKIAERYLDVFQKAIQSFN